VLLGPHRLKDVLKQFLKKVHPDLFGRFPDLRAKNEYAVRQLMGILDDAKNSESGTYVVRGRAAAGCAAAAAGCAAAAAGCAAAAAGCAAAAAGGALLLQMCWCVQVPCVVWCAVRVGVRC
jgi:hypothetical protein